MQEINKNNQRKFESQVFFNKKNVMKLFHSTSNTNNINFKQSFFNEILDNENQIQNFMQKILNDIYLLQKMMKF